MKQTEGVHSVHFPTASRNGPVTDDAGRTGRQNALELFANAHRDTDVIREKLRGLLTSTSRHGDLQAALSAARRLNVILQALIGHEEL